MHGEGVFVGFWGSNAPVQASHEADDMSRVGAGSLVIFICWPEA